MVDLITFRNEVSLIVNNLAKAVVTEIFTAAEKVSLNRLNPETEEQLGALVDRLCVEAVEKILNMVESGAERQEKMGPPSGENSEGLTAGEDSGGGEHTEQTFILLYEVNERIHSCRKKTLTQLNADDCSVLQSTAADSDALLVSLEDADNAEGKNKTSCSRPLDVPDHEYARPSSPPGEVPAARNRRSKASTPAPHHECSHCRMLFPSIERLTDHQQKSHPACSVCGSLFTGILKLREHESKEHGLLPYACDYCPKRFNHKAHRDLHIKARHTGEKPCHCDICGKGYSCVSVLKTHRITHFDKTFICDVCGKSFYHACHLTRHKLVHQEVRLYRCSTCGKGFTQAANLRSHQAIHTGDRQLCSICGRSYRCLKNHLIRKHSEELHANELPATDAIIACSVCGKKFPNPSQLKVHQRSHTGEKPFHCDICGKSYRLKELLRDHRYTHTGEKPYSCSLCPKTFNLATSFMRHRSIHSGVTPYSCLDCGKHFRLLTFLKAHLQTKAHLKQMQHRHAISSDL